MLLFIATKKANDNKDNLIKFQVENPYAGIENCNLILLKQLYLNKINYLQYVFALKFDFKKKFEKDKLPLRLKIKNGPSFKKDIYINKKINKRHYFWFDFDGYDNFKRINLLELELSKCEKFKLFKDAIDSKDFGFENIEKDFLIDSMENLIDKKNIFSLELMLEILDFYYNKNEGKLLIKYLEDKWDYVYNCKKLNSYYYNILTKLQEKFFKESINHSNGFPILI